MQVSTSTLAEYAVEVSFDDLPDEVVEKSKRFVLDTIGCCFGAYASPPVEYLIALYGDEPGEENRATVLGAGTKTNPEYAALINGTMARYLDYNDTYMGKRSGCHPSDHIPVLVSVAEAEGATGKELVEAIVIAYELEGAGLETGAIWERTGFDYVTWGAYSTAASVGNLMGLTRDELENAIGIAGTSNVPLSIARRGEVSMWKGLAHAYISHNAVQACQMARAGITGPAELFEGNGGLFEVLDVDDVEFDGMGGREGQEYRILNSNVKPFATGYWIQSGVTGVLELVDENDIDAAQIESINIQMWDEAVSLLGDPTKWSTDLTRETADHSVPYTVAIAIVDGEVTPKQFTADRLDDERVHELMGKIEVEANPELTQYRREHYADIPSIITIVTADDSYETRVNYPNGHAKNPMSDEELERKMSGLAAEYLSEEQIEGTIAACYALDERGSVDRLIASTTIEV